MTKLIAEISIEENGNTVSAAFCGNEGSSRRARDLAADIISGFPEESLNDIYLFFSDVAAQMAAMSDNPGLMASEHSARIDLYEAEFARLKQGLVRYRPADGARGMKS